MASSAITGALRVGLQIIVAQKRPVLEVYQGFHNDFGPPIEHRRMQSTHRRQEIYIDLTLVNIGAVRAENVTFEVSGDFRRDGLREIPERFKSIVRQLAPGQSMFLMKIEDHDLNVYAPENPEKPSSYKAVGIKTETLQISINYDGPRTLWNRVHRWTRRWRGLKQYSSDFTFDPQTVLGDLPPPTYHG
jgi:hypothetical protein